MEPESYWECGSLSSLLAGQGHHGGGWGTAGQKEEAPGWGKRRKAFLWKGRERTVGT